MFGFISGWRKRQQEKRYWNGRTYAAQVLSKDLDAGEEYLRANVEISRDFGCFDEFDIGVEDEIISARRNAT
jgi:hypothetical protein